MHEYITLEAAHQFVRHRFCNKVNNGKISISEKN